MRNTAAFASGGPVFTVSGLRPRRETYNAGAGATLANNGSWSVGMSYDYEWRNDSYSAHQSMLKFVLHI